MPHTILYAGEYGIALPEQVLTNSSYHILIAHTADEAITRIDTERGGIDGYVLGMILIKNGIAPATVVAAEKAFRAALRYSGSLRERVQPQLAEQLPGGLDGHQQYMAQQGAQYLKEIYHAMLDIDGGANVVMHMHGAGEFGKKPTLLYTTSPQDVLVKEFRFRKADNIAVLVCPCSSADITSWFVRNFP